ncbi:DUF5693 family protein [Paenibacillus sp. N1-5-1-14]|uniref:DUF5693 family protein n=1 Tax=Paenibacillus radicibacter TaxID=2972488 RepID=UPI002158E78F|nr:DUF5693 family protein [Paenibacillus radicibacter]MCR8645064.1 DUF5693 family protein [Paenibacillus radicibacter]
MFKTYRAWNDKVRKLLIVLVVLGLVASVPLVLERENTETSANNVEFVFDYRDLLDIADMQSNPLGFVDEHLEKMKTAGILSMSVYEGTLQEMKQQRRLEVFSSREAMSLTQQLLPPGENNTYVLFSNQDAQNTLQPIIEKGFADFGVATKPWTFKDRKGLIIEMASDDALMRPMDPDPMTMKMLKDKGFHIVVRMSNKRPFEPKQMNKLIASFKEYGVTRIIPDSDAVPGFTDKPNDLLDMASILRDHNIGLAGIEMLKAPQKGFNKLASKIEYDVVRLHSFTEKDTEKFMEPVDREEIHQRVLDAADRFVLAVKDRNIRMVFLNAKISKSLDKKKVDHPLDSLYEAINGEGGAIPRIEKAGFKDAPAVAFTVDHGSFITTWQKVAPYFLLLGGVALIALTLSYFVPSLTLLMFVIGLLGAGGLRILSESLYSQGFALGVSICAATLSVILAIRTVNNGGAKWARGNRVLFTTWMLVRTSLISLIGAFYLIALLNQVKYFLVLEQFRGVSMLHLVPIALAGIYVLLFNEKMTSAQRMQRIREILKSKISVLAIVLVGIALAAVYYYLSRTGNAGTTSSLERTFRAFLENTLGVRPRTKEFLIAHPLFILGGYLALKYKHAIYLLAVGVVGQLSIIDTFAHLHTPLEISGIRIVYGLMFGFLIGLVLIVVWEIALRSWRKWGAPLLEK